jgi:hypothetical protein
MELSQADFAMSKIAVNEVYGGNRLRKAIDYFCHMAVAPEFYGKIKERDPAFAATKGLPKLPPSKGTQARQGPQPGKLGPLRGVSINPDIP